MFFLFLFPFIRSVAPDSDEAIKKEHGMFIMTIVKDEMDKSLKDLKLQNILQHIAMDTIDIKSLKRKNPNIDQINRLKSSIRNLYQQIRKEHWEELKFKVDHQKKLQKDRLKSKVTNLLPVFKTPTNPLYQPVLLYPSGLPQIPNYPQGYMGYPPGNPNLVFNNMPRKKNMNMNRIRKRNI